MMLHRLFPWLVLLALSSGCDLESLDPGGGDPPETPDPPSFVSGYWNHECDSNGQATHAQESYRLQFSVTRPDGSAARNARVLLYTGSGSALCWAQETGYAPAFHWLQEQDLQPLESRMEHKGDRRVAEDTPVDLQLGEAADALLPREGGVIRSIAGDDPLLHSDCRQAAPGELFEELQQQSLDWFLLRAEGRGLSSGSHPKEAFVRAGAAGEADFLAFCTSHFGYTDDDTLSYCFEELPAGTQPALLPRVRIRDFREGPGIFDWRFVLSWEQSPLDLDLHLWTPPIDGQAHHVYYGNRGSLDRTPWCQLGEDATDAGGAEVLTIADARPGEYRLMVTDYSGAGGLSASGALLEVYRHGALQQDLAVPPGESGSNRWWFVGTITDSVFTEIGEFRDQGGAPPVDALPAKQR